VIAALSEYVLPTQWTITGRLSQAELAFPDARPYW